MDFALLTKIKANHNLWSTSAKTHDKDKADPPPKVQKSSPSSYAQKLEHWKGQQQQKNSRKIPNR